MRVIVIGAGRGRDGAGLATATADTLDGWAPPVRRLVTATDPDTAAHYRFHTADPDADLTPWPAWKPCCGPAPWTGPSSGRPG